MENWENQNVGDYYPATEREANILAHLGRWDQSLSLVIACQNKLNRYIELRHQGKSVDEAIEEVIANNVPWDNRFIFRMIKLRMETGVSLSEAKKTLMEEDGVDLERYGKDVVAALEVVCDQSDDLHLDDDTWRHKCGCSEATHLDGGCRLTKKG